MTARKYVVSILTALTCGLIFAAGVLAISRDDSQPAVGTAAATLGGLDSQTTGASLPPALETLARSGPSAEVPNNQYEGNWNIDQARELADSSAGTRLVAIPTDRGLVCYAIISDQDWGGGCVKDLTADRPIGFSVYDPDAPTSGRPPSVGGIANPDVVAVHIIAGQQASSAPITNGGFVAGMASPQQYPDAIEVTMADGSTLEFPIPDPRQAMLSAER